MYIRHSVLTYPHSIIRTRTLEFSVVFENDIIVSLLMMDGVELSYIRYHIFYEITIVRLKSGPLIKFIKYFKVGR